VEEAVKLSELIANYEEQGSPFATHLNLLRALGPGIKSVLELGTGEYSTSLFTDRRYYPDLIELISVESEKHWADTAPRQDPRQKVVFISEPIEPFLAMIPLDQIDLILCDNSIHGDRRCATLRWLSENVGRSLVVAHDYNVPSYAEACRGFDHVFVDDRQSPHTALLWRSRCL